jgi:hypothetical protein
MSRVRLPTVVIWALPIGLFVFALFLGVRAYREHHAPPRDGEESSIVAVCRPGRARCRARVVEISTGEQGDGGPTSCVFREAGRCLENCVVPDVELADVDEAIARTQLCDPPAEPSELVAEDRSFLDKPIAEAVSCEGDGYIPTAEGFLQCISRSGSDPMATGIVLADVRCRDGAVPTTDRAPRLIRREQAIALWCLRPRADPDAAPETETTPETAVDGD